MRIGLALGNVVTTWLKTGIMLLSIWRRSEKMESLVKYFPRMAQNIGDQISNSRCGSLIAPWNNQKANHRFRTIGDFVCCESTKIQVGMDVPETTAITFGTTPLTRAPTRKHDYYNTVYTETWPHSLEYHAQPVSAIQHSIRCGAPR